jgi:TonB-dependent Receptor Plug Domain
MKPATLAPPYRTRGSWVLRQTAAWGLLLLAAALGRAQPELPPTLVPGERITPPPPAGTEPPLPPEAPTFLPSLNPGTSRSSPVSNAIGASPSASEGSINQLDLANQPILRPGDVFEFIPGLLAEDHTGTVKANEYFLRGFFIDHGTDFSIWVDDVPYNMPNHPHLHGYLDINSVFPELIQTIDFQKGVYYADAGDLSSAGHVNTTMVDSLPYGIFKSEFGKNDYFRELVANSAPLGQGVLLYAVSAEYFNGPWEYPENSRLFDGMLRYTMGDAQDGLRLTAWAYSGAGRINDNIPTEAIEAGAINRFGTLDPFENLHTTRDQLNLQWWHRDDAGDVTKANVYYIYYQFRIFTNTTGTAIDDSSINASTGQLNTGVSDEFEQYDSHRSVYGTNFSQMMPSRIFGDNVQNTVGTQIRFDLDPSVGTNHTVANNLYVPLDNASIQELNAGFYYENQIKWGPKVRTVLAFREDYFHWDVCDSLIYQNSGNTQAWVPQPKGSLILGPWDKTEFYLNGGYGFHTNDARGIFNYESPDFVNGTAARFLTPGQPAEPIARSRGCEIGTKTQLIPNLTTTAALWYLKLQSELVFDPFGITAAEDVRGPSDRYGIELSNTYRFERWLTFDCDWSASQAHFTTTDFNDAVGPAGGNDVPQAVDVLFSAGPTVRLPNGYFAVLHYKYLGPRALTSDDVIASKATNWWDLGVGYENQRLVCGVNIINLFNSNDHEIDFANVDPGATINGVNYTGGTTGHPMQPFQARFYFNLKW